MVVLDDVDGTRSPGLPGVSARLAKEAKERSAGIFVLVPERSWCVVSAADIIVTTDQWFKCSKTISRVRNYVMLEFKMVVPK